VASAHGAHGEEKAVQAGITLSVEAGHSPEGQVLGFHAGPYFSLPKNGFTFVPSLGLETLGGRSYNFNIVTLGLETGWQVHRKVALVNILHAGFMPSAFDFSVLFGFEMNFHTSKSDSINIGLAVGKMIGSPPGVMTGLINFHWSFYLGEFRHDED
jgi:hypothetical protein